MSERFVFDGDLDHLDEIVLHDVTLHIEAMDHHHYFVGITRNGHTIRLSAADVRYRGTENDDGNGGGWPVLDVRAPLLGCGVEWTDGYRIHRCEAVKPHAGPHMCHCCSPDFVHPPDHWEAT